MTYSALTIGYIYCIYNTLLAEYQDLILLQFITRHYFKILFKDIDRNVELDIKRQNESHSFTIILMLCVLCFQLLCNKSLKSRKCLYCTFLYYTTLSYYQILFCFWLFIVLFEHQLIDSKTRRLIIAQIYFVIIILYTDLLYLYVFPFQMMRIRKTIYQGYIHIYCVSSA